MSNNEETGSGTCKGSDDSEEMRDDLNRIITNYPSMKISTTLGVLRLLEAELIERLRTSGPATDRKP